CSSDLLLPVQGDGGDGLNRLSGQMQPRTRSALQGDGTCRLADRGACRVAHDGGGYVQVRGHGVCLRVIDSHPTRLQVGDSRERFEGHGTSPPCQAPLAIRPAAIRALTTSATVALSGSTYSATGTAGMAGRSERSLYEPDVATAARSSGWTAVSANAPWAAVAYVPS